jgi:hypothetical protein
MRRFFVILLSVALAIFLLERLRVIGFRYPRVVENDPLLAPINVTSIEGDQWTLEDGRVLHMTIIDDREQPQFRAGQPQLRVDLQQEGSDTIVFVKRRSWVCGTPWACEIKIPLFPDDVSINRREPIGFAKVDPPRVPQN